MKNEVYDRIKYYVDNDIPINVIFYSDVECGGQYGGVCFDSTKGSIEMNDDFLIVTDEKSVSIMRWENVICTYIYW